MKRFLRYLPLIGVLLFFLILRFWKISLADTLAMLRQSDWRMLLLGLLFFVLMVYLKGIRWSYLLKMQGVSYPVWDSFLVYMGTLYLGNLTPGRAGDFAKVFYLKKDLKLSIGTGFASVLVDRVFDLYLLLVLGGLGILMNPMPADPISAKIVFGVKLSFAVLAAITLLAFNKKIGGILLKAAFQRLMKQEHRDKTDKLFEDFHEGMEAYYRPSILVPALLSVASYGFFFCGCYLLGQSYGLGVNIAYLSFCVSVVNIASLFTFLGMGTREATLIFLFGLISKTTTQAMTYDFLLFFIGVVLFSLLGLICFLLKPIQLVDEPRSKPNRAASKPRKSASAKRRKSTTSKR